MSTRLLRACMTGRMRRLVPSASAGLLAAVLGSFGCGGAPPPPAAAPQPPPTAAPVASVAADVTPTPDLAPAPEPADVIGTLRWKNPMAMFATAAQSAGAP